MCETTCLEDVKLHQGSD